MIMDVYINHLDTFAGKGVNVTESKKSVAKRDKKFFVSMINTLTKLDDRSSALMEMGIDMIRYEDPYFQLIEDLILKAYGPLKGNIILWWCGERKLLDVEKYNMVDENGKGTIISNIIQLYTYLNKLK